MSGLGRRALPAIVLVATWCLAPGVVNGAADGSSDATGYCVPQNTAFDPSDLGVALLSPLPRGLRERFVTLAGVRTPVLESGPARDAGAVVFVHGNPGSSRDFVELMAQARRLGIRLVAFDLPGFGRARRPWTFPYTADGYTRWFTAALRQLRIKRAILVVHDVGGPLGMQWAAAHPGSFAGTVIIDSGVLVGYQDHYLARIWKTPVLGEQFMAATTHDVFAAGIENGQQRPLPQAFVDRMYAEYDRATRCAILSVYRSVPDVDAYAQAQAAILRPLNRPALVIWGAHDPYLPTQLAYNQRQAFPSAEVDVLDDAAHWPFIDDPLKVDRLVVGFLTRTRRRIQSPPRAHRPTHPRRAGRKHRGAAGRAR